MKKLLPIVLSILVSLASTIGCNAADEGESWYFKKHRDEFPSCGVDASFLDETNSIWLDTAAHEQKTIYLTFDVGYINENVISILDILMKENVPAAFFVLGHPILKNTDVIVRMKEDGHMVCSHTRGHGDISKMSDEQIENELSTLEKIYEEKTGYTLDKFFRPPEGRYSKRSLMKIKSLGYRTVFWSYAYADWDEKTVHSETKILKKLTENAHPGEILLLHPTSSINVKILKPLIGALRQNGFTFGSLDQIE